MKVINGDGSQRIKSEQRKYEICKKDEEEGEGGGEEGKKGSQQNFV